VARHRWWTDALRGAVAGAVATWVMDGVTTAMLESQPKQVTNREEAAQPNGRSSVGNLVANAQSAVGIRLRIANRRKVETAVHYALGIVPGAIYGALRPRVPGLGAARGLAYGTAVFLLNDELLNTKLGLAGPITAYPTQTHLRGLVGHVVLGATMDTGLDLLGA
jgi:uncharacterized membrane protein YagU involved in acid resistance